MNLNQTAKPILRVIHAAMPMSATVDIYRTHTPEQIAYNDKLISAFLARSSK